jgi:hypothetical protein
VWVSYGRNKRYCLDRSEYWINKVLAEGAGPAILRFSHRVKWQNPVISSSLDTCYLVLFETAMSTCSSTLRRLHRLEPIGTQQSLSSF